MDEVDRVVVCPSDSGPLKWRAEASADAARIHSRGPVARPYGNHGTEPSVVRVAP